MPWLVRQSGNAEGLAADTAMQAAGVLLTGCPAALTGPLDSSQAPGWPGTPWVVRLKVLPPGPVIGPLFTEVTGMTMWSAWARFGRTHSGTAIWRAAVTARAGMVRRISAPAAMPRVKANAA